MNPAATWAQSLAKVSKREWIDPILDQLPVGFIIIEAPTGRVLEGNRHLERIFRHPIRYSAGVADYGEWVGYHQDGRPYAPGDWPVARALAGEVTTNEEIEIERGDGTRGFISIDAAPIRDEEGGILAALAIIQDVTDRKLLEHRERQAAKRLQDMLESTTDCVFMLDREWRFTFMNRRAVKEVAGGRDLTGLNIWEEYPHAVGSTFWERYHRAMDERVPVTFEAYYPPPLASWYDVHAFPAEEGVAVFFRNITPDREARERLRESQERLRISEARARDFADIASDWFWELDADLRLTYVGGLVEMLPEGAGLGKTRWESLGGDPNAEPWASHVRLLKARKDFRDFKFQTSSRSGRPVWISSSGRAIFDESGTFTGYRGVSINITERKRAEEERERLTEQLVQAQKMEAMGQLTGGVAHDFNNLLTVILGNAELLAEEIEDPDLRSLAKMTEETASRAADLIGKLLAFGRRQTLKPEPVVLDDAVLGMVGLFKRTLGEHVEIKLEMKQSQSAALTDRGLLESALLNLAVNARDAMPKGGTLTISTGERFAGRNDDTIPVGQPVVFVTVSDTGIGMSPDVLARVFEPFFTTKDVGQGTGLGLAMVYGFAQQSGGHVLIESEAGKGTSVSIVLRAVPREGDPPAENDRAEPTRGGERVLLVEDEPGVRQFAETQLKSLGYEVVAAGTAREAVALIENDHCFDLLLTDVVLPQGMSGVELSRLAVDKCPGLKVLLTSGYSEDVFEQHGRPADGTLLLRKPYRRKELAETLRNVLGQAPA